MARDKSDAPRLLKIAAAQYPLDAVPSLDAWHDKLRRWVHDGVATGAEVLVFPEYAALETAATFGAQVSHDLQKSLDHVSQCAGERTKIWSALAKEFGVTLLTGSGPVQTSDGRYLNASQLVTPSGLIGEQHKLMMTPFERDWGISPGTTLHVFETPHARFAICICYDIEFPLIAHAAAKLGADCILVPSCTERMSGFNRVKTGALARALENSIATVQSPTIGDALWSPAIDHNAGAAGFYVPAEHDMSETGIIALGTANEAAWVYGEINLTRLHALRTQGEMRNFQDWDVQPGAGSTPFTTEVVDLRS